MPPPAWMRNRYGSPIPSMFVFTLSCQFIVVFIFPALCIAALPARSVVDRRNKIQAEVKRRLPHRKRPRGANDGLVDPCRFDSPLIHCRRCRGAAGGNWAASSEVTFTGCLHLSSLPPPPSRFAVCPQCDPPFRHHLFALLAGNAHCGENGGEGRVAR